MIAAWSALAWAAACAGPPPHGLVPLEPSLRVDRANGLVILDAEVVQRDAALELLLCPRRTKDHETILAADFKPQNFQAALLLAGALPGLPVQYEPSFRPPSGQRLKFWIETERDGRVQRIDLREWVQGINGKAMDADLVFAGSRIFQLPGIEAPRFAADEGDVVRVANTPEAIVDVARRSGKEDANLQFRPWKDRIPEAGTLVKVIVEPLVD